MYTSKRFISRNHMCRRVFLCLTIKLKYIETKTRLNDYHTKEQSLISQADGKAGSAIFNRTFAFNFKAKQEN